MLRQFNVHIGWLIAYAWNPLVIKEIANGGHLDSIAVLLMMVAIFSLTRWIQNHEQQKPAGVSALIAAGIALGLGFGAKLFPIVLFPAFVVAVGRVKWSAAMMFSVLFLVTSFLVLAPMYWDSGSQVQLASATDATNGEPGQQQKEGLASFLSRWRMNDVIFSGIYLNLKPGSPNTEPWFVGLPRETRNQITDWCKRHSLGGQRPAFFLARMITLGIFAVFYLYQLAVIYRATQAVGFDRLVLIMAVFLFLQPTVNPWYWTWVVALTPLARSRGWVLVAGILMVYYSRFWFRKLSETYEFLGVQYSGAGLFDHFVAWGEFGAIVCVLTGVHLFRLSKKSETGES